MITHSYTIVHYGKDYLNYALRSVYDAVDQLQVVYTPHPSHGHRTDQPPPETSDELQAAAFSYDPQNKIKWHETDIWNEGPQRDRALQICKEAGAELVLVVDADEVWSEITLYRALNHCEQHPARNHLINFVHFWRSFNWVCRDNNWPVRFIDLTRPNNSNDNDYVPQDVGDIFHFGYCVTDKILRYKLSIHGHKNEIRPDWYETKWKAWPPPPDCHPTNSNNWWMPEPFDRSKLPPVMHGHPFFNVERIE